MVGTGVGANLGEPAAGGAALEHAAACRVVVFDKTGTLTQGKPRVVGCQAYKMTEDALVRAGGLLRAARRTLRLAHGERPNRGFIIKGRRREGC